MDCVKTSLRFADVGVCVKSECRARIMLVHAYVFMDRSCEHVQFACVLFVQRQLHTNA